MKAYNFRPGDDGNDPFLVVIFTIICVTITIIFAGVIILVFKDTIYW